MEDKCAGCTCKIFFDKETWQTIPKSLIDGDIGKCFNYGKWDWVCFNTRVGVRKFRHCPCWDCLIRPTCNTSCQEYKNIMNKCGHQYKVWILDK